MSSLRKPKQVNENPFEVEFLASVYFNFIYIDRSLQNKKFMAAENLLAFFFFF